MPTNRYTIHTNPPGYTICREGDPANRLVVRDLAELLRLRTRLNQFVDDQQDDGPGPPMPIVPAPAAYSQPLINTRLALRQALARGYTLPGSTFRSACERGDIPGAVTDGVHWLVPADAFTAWLEVWIKRKGGE